MKASTYIKMMCIPSAEQLDAMVQQAMQGVTREKMEEIISQMLAGQTGMTPDEISAYLKKMPDEDLTETYTEMVTQQAKMQYAAGVRAQMAAVPPAQLVMALDAGMKTYTDE